MEAIDKKGFPVLYDKEYIEKIIAKVDDKVITDKADKKDNYIYTLSGQRIISVDQLKHGIYIVNKKKVIY